MEIKQGSFHGPGRPSKKPRGRVLGSQNFDTEDDLAILEIAESIVPLGGFGWGPVAERLNREFHKESQTRTGESCKKRWERLVKIQKGTGSLTVQIPSAVPRDSGMRCVKMPESPPSQILLLLRRRLKRLHQLFRMNRYLPINPLAHLRTLKSRKTQSVGINDRRTNLEPRLEHEARHSRKWLQVSINLSM